ncbi:MAG TPA: DMT family transporter [Candidatus Saccharimonadales bacterium]|nr:DMT family transporter [Candidatus Saccharimonadales bacterium]
MKSKSASITTKGTIALIVLAAIYALFGVAARYLSVGIGVYEQWYVRLAVAFVMAAIIFHRSIEWRKFRHLPAREWWALLVRTIVGQVIGIGLFTLAAEKTEIGILAFMGALPASSLLAIIIFRDKTSWKKAALLALSFFGAVIIVINNFHDLMNFDVGAILALLSTFFFALMLVGRRWHTGKLNNQEITVAMLAISCVATYILSLALYHRAFIPAVHWTPAFTWAIIASGALSAASFFLANYGFEHVSAVVAGNILTLEILFGPLFGWMFYSETLSIKVIIGGIIIMASVILMNQQARRENAAAQIAAVPD